MSDPKETKQQKYIICKVEKVIFRDDNTGRTIMSVIQNDGKHTRLLGKTSKVDTGYVLKANGAWSKDEKYGWQFNADFTQTVSVNPEAEDSIYIECKVKEVQVIKAETGFASAKVETADGNIFRMSGRVAKMRQGASIGIFGKWNHDERYGDEFQVTLWEYKSNDTATALSKAYEFIRSIQPSVTSDSIDSNEEPTEHNIKEVKEHYPWDSVNLVIPDGVTSIEDGAFADCVSLCSVVVPDSVTSIGDEAFSNCVNLNTIILGNNVRSIGKYAFKGCNELQCITIPTSMNSIGYHAFWDCRNISNVKIASKDINDFVQFLLWTENPIFAVYQFDDAKRSVIINGIEQKSITIPDGITNIPEGSFYRFQDLEEIGIPETVTTIGDRAFLNCFSLTSILIPDSVSSIGEETFYGCKKLHDVTIPDSVADIGRYAFSGCSELTSVILSNKLETIPYCAFKDCYKLNSIVIPESVKNIEEWAFAQCKQLTEINILASFIDIHHSAFWHVPNKLKHRIVELDWMDVKIGENEIKIPKPFGGMINIRCNKIDKWMNKMRKYIAQNFPNLIVHYYYNSEPEIANPEILQDIVDNLTKEYVLEIDWNDIKLGDSEIKIPTPFGTLSGIEYHSVYKWMNKMRKQVAQNFPKLIIHYCHNHETRIGNPEVLQDVADVLTMKHDLEGVIAEQGDPSEIIERLSKIDNSSSRIFVPLEKTYYINYLEQNHALADYPIVPVDEVFRRYGESGEDVGKTKESGALFTLVKEGQPYIVWENYKDSRATFVFRCTRENYKDRMNLIFNFIMSDKEGKRQYLHTEACTEIFGERPMIVVHNNLESWSSRLMMPDGITEMDLEEYIIDHSEEQ